LVITESIFLKLLLLATIFSLYYHLANGIRHLFWDIGKGYEITSAYISGYIVIIFSILMTVITVYFGFFSQ
jgi:succinate dehydrogenase / fumarate reductase cytochrome b subunit